MNKKNVLTFIVVIGVAVGAYFGFSQPPSADHRPAAVEEKTDVGTSEETITTPPEKDVSGKYNFNVISRDAWPLTERAEAAIASLAPGQFIGDVVEDPTQDNVAYFAASTEIAADGSRLISVYRYQTDDYNWERLFRGTYKPGEFPVLCETCYPTLNVAGYDSGKLVLIAKDNDYGGGRCWFQLVDSVDDRSDSFTLVSMDIAHPYDGFAEYTPPQAIYDASRAEQAACEAGLE